MNGFSTYIEIFKCTMLAAIFIALVSIYIKMPIPFTMGNIEKGKVGMEHLPVVRIQGGSIDADVSGSVVKVAK